MCDGLWVFLVGFLCQFEVCQVVWGWLCVAWVGFFGSVFIWICMILCFCEGADIATFLDVLWTCSIVL